MHLINSSPSNFSGKTSKPTVLNISINNERAWDINVNTAGQAQDPTWFEERKLRLTALKFGKVLHREKEPTEPFLKSILPAKDLSNVASIRHGKLSSWISLCKENAEALE